MNAIILAAGMGTRIRPLTDHTPKPLIKVNGERIIERQIKYLNRIGINDIVIVTGYLNEEFNYLAPKYNVELVNNDKFNIYNNGYTMYLVREYLHNTYILEGDVFLTDNFLKKNINHSTYFSGIKHDFLGEWILEYNELGRVTAISIGDGTDYIMSGISYWIEEDSAIIKSKLDHMVKKNGFENLFWDNLVKDNLKEFNIKIEKIKSTDWFEIDSMTDLEKAESYMKNV